MIVYYTVFSSWNQLIFPARPFLTHKKTAVHRLSARQSCQIGSSVTVAAVLAYQPVLAQALGLFPAAAHTVEQPPFQRAVRIANFRHPICIPERFPSFLSRHQIALFHSFRASFPAALAAQRAYFITFWPGGLFALSTKSALHFMGECALTNLDSTAFLFLPDKIPGV